MNIVGSGLIASAFKGAKSDYDVTIFASGVSNSRETRSSEFDRESILLKSFSECEESLLYFSTCSVEDDARSPSPYVKHKLEMEKTVLKSNRNLVIRLPQVVGKSSNPNTLTNFFASKIYSGESYELYGSSTRYLIDIDDVVKLTDYLIRSNRFGSITSFSPPTGCDALRIVCILQDVMNKSSNHILKEGNTFEYSQSGFVADALSAGVVEFGPDYVEKVLHKYYSKYPG